MQGIGSAVILNVMLWVALIVSIPLWGFSDVYLTAAGVGVVLLGGAGFLLVLFTRGEHWVGARLERLAGKVPFVDGSAVRGFFEQVAARLQEIGQQRRVLVRAVLWAGANWLLDAASLAVFLGAFGHWANPDAILVAYGLANVLAVIPITPGGLGVIEATLTSVLVGFGTPRGVAITGVVAYRLVNFWLPIPLGGLAYLSLQVTPGGSALDRHRGGSTRGRSLWSRFGRGRGWLDQESDPPARGRRRSSTSDTGQLPGFDRVASWRPLLLAIGREPQDAPTRDHQPRCGATSAAIPAQPKSQKIENCPRGQNDCQGLSGAQDRREYEHEHNFSDASPCRSGDEEDSCGDC